MHRDEIPIDVALVRGLLATQFPQWADLPLEPVVPTGTDNVLFRVGEDMVARLPRREQASRTLRKEHYWLPRLAPALPVAVPLPLGAGEPTAEFPFVWAIYRSIDGEAAALADVSDLERFAWELARFVAALQAITATDGPEPGEHNFFRGVPLHQRDAATRAAMSALGRAIDANAVTAAWETALNAPEWERPAIWIHRDLDARNLLVIAA